MNTKPFIYCSILLISFFSCKKSDSTSSADGYSVNGISDLTLKQDSSLTIPLVIQQNAGEQKTVSLSVSGAPQNVSATLSSSSGIPTFSSQLTLTATGNAAVGSYNMKVSATSATGTKDYSFKLNIQESSDCTPAFIGTKNAQDVCSVTGNSNYTVVITKSPTVKNRILIKNFGHLGGNTPDYVYADLNCSNKTINIPAQAITNSSSGVATVSGSGTFTGSKMMISWIFDTGTPSTCNLVIQ